MELLDIPNPHLLVLGRSGAGKTYFACRQIEEQYKHGNRIYIFDYSASYTLSELEKNRFKYLDVLETINPMQTEMCWNFSGKNIEGSLVDALLRGLKIQSYYQKKLLLEGIETVFEENDYFSIPLLVKTFESLYESKEDSESKKNTVHLLNRFGPFSEIEEVMVSNKPADRNEAKITLIQLSDYPEIQRKFLTEFLAELLWEEVRHGEKKADIVLFDEFQNMDIKQGSAISSMLREGRKFGFAAYLSSQFFGNYDKETVETLTQAGNILFFKPTEKEMKFISKMIDNDFAKDWHNVLNKLKVGECVIKGNYQINKKNRAITRPLLCMVKQVENP